MPDQLAASDEGAPEDFLSKGCAPIALATISAFLICALLWIVIFLLAPTVMTLIYWTPWTHNSLITLSAITPYFLVIVPTVTYVTYVVALWFNRRGLGIAAKRMLIASGGVLIPFGASALHYDHYRRAPDDYVISSDNLPYLQRMAASSLGRAQAEIQRFREARQAISQLLARRPSLPARLRFIDGSPSWQVCSRLDLGPQTGALCVRHDVQFYQDPVMTGTATRNTIRAIERFQVRLNPHRRLTPDSVDLVGLVQSAEFYCRIRDAIFDPGFPARSGADTERLFRCLAVADRAFAATIGSDLRTLARAPRHPDLSYWVIFLDSTAGLVGADYSVLEPVSPEAGFISVAGSISLWVYFAVFASLILDAVSAKGESAAPPEVDPPEGKKV